jgi:hypothetical protein
MIPLVAGVGVIVVVIFMAGAFAALHLLASVARATLGLLRGGNRR